MAATPPDAGNACKASLSGGFRGLGGKGSLCLDPPPPPPCGLDGINNAERTQQCCCNVRSGRPCYRKAASPGGDEKASDGLGRLPVWCSTARTRILFTVSTRDTYCAAGMITVQFHLRAKNHLRHFYFLYCCRRQRLHHFPRPL